jgi:hypothetical protein
MLNENLVRFAHNLLECWNIGMLGLEDWGNEVSRYWGNGKVVFFLSESIDK